MMYWCFLWHTEYDLTPRTAPFLDVHLVLPIFAFLEESGVSLSIMVAAIQSDQNDLYTLFYDVSDV